MRAVVTGGAGFIGRHLCKRLLDEGYDVVCVDNFLTSSRDKLSELEQNPKFSLIEHDVTKPLEIDGAVDVVLHFASAASPIDYMNYPIQTLKVGAMGTHNTLGLAKRKMRSLCSLPHLKSTVTRLCILSLSLTGAMSTPLVRGASMMKQSAMPRLSRWPITACTASRPE